MSIRFAFCVVALCALALLALEASAKISSGPSFNCNCNCGATLGTWQTNFTLALSCPKKVGPNETTHSIAINKCFMACEASLAVRCRYSTFNPCRKGMCGIDGPCFAAGCQMTSGCNNSTGADCTGKATCNACIGEYRASSIGNFAC